MAKSNLTPSKVFVPGGMPVITYVPRTERELEGRLQSVTDNLCKLVTLTGATKSGKTVLANKVFPGHLATQYGLMAALLTRKRRFGERCTPRSMQTRK